MRCPKCGHEQPEQPECERCGVVIARARPTITPTTTFSPPAADAAPTSRRATTAFVLGIVGVVCCQLTAPAAWVLGSRELKSVREGRSAAAGRGFALTGMILGIVGSALLLVSLLIVPAILVPNFLDALQKAKQQRTLADLRSVGAALEAYCAKHWDEVGCYPEATSMEELAAVFSVSGLAPPVTVDGWKRPLHYGCWADPGVAGCQHAVLRSAGRDGELEFEDPNAYPSGPFDANDYHRDIVWMDGLFRTYPGGPAKSPE